MAWQGGGAAGSVTRQDHDVDGRQQHAGERQDIKQWAVDGAPRRTEQLGIHPEALRTWVKRSEIDAGDRTGTTSSDAERIAQLERENQELRRANAILKSASAFFASMSR
ncbi:hypothetical protein GCM10022267_84830 [Lentzea roselyniae]|uniref:Transposase n=1 Tax=Lentzea roselyniae TaxID=531940 RepID=A0ABP7CDY1_9PSEU